MNFSSNTYFVICLRPRKLLNSLEECHFCLPSILWLRNYNALAPKRSAKGVDWVLPRFSIWQYKFDIQINSSNSFVLTVPLYLHFPLLALISRSNINYSLLVFIWGFWFKFLQTCRFNNNYSSNAFIKIIFIKNVRLAWQAVSISCFLLSQKQIIPPVSN